MIARSDLFILLVSTSLLAVGIFRWQQNVAMATTTASVPRTQIGQLPANQVPVQPAPVTQQSIGNAPASTALSNVSHTTALTVDTIGAAPKGTSDVGTSSNSTAADTPQELAASPASQTSSGEPLYGSYTVVSGDYLSKIAQIYGTSVSTLQSINNIKGSRIEIGQLILYPLPAN